MSGPRLPLGDGDVPDKVLEELLAAFADDVSADQDFASRADAIDLDDPSIDKLLGLDPSPSIAARPDRGSGSEPTVGDDLITTPVPETPGAPPHHPPTRQPVGDEPGVIAADTPIGDVASVDAVAPAVASADDEADLDLEPRRRAPIKIGGDENFVDAVYLDEDGEDRLRSEGGLASADRSSSGPRQTIQIGDDEIEGSAGGIPVASSSMDPRLRARRIAVKRAIGRKRLRWIILAAGVVIVVTTGLALLGSSLFEVKADPEHLTISGVRYMSQDDLRAAVEKIANHPVLLIDTHSIEVQLEKSPWVREARVQTDFPDKASIEIVERVPLATYVGTDARYRIIDVEGNVVDVIDGRPLEFMLVTGSGPNAEPGENVGTNFRHAAELVEALSPAVRSRTREVVVGDTGDLSLTFHTNGTVVVLGAPENLLDKLTRLEAFLKRADAETCTRLDVSTTEIGCK